MPGSVPRDSAAASLTSINLQILPAVCEASTCSPIFLKAVESWTDLGYGAYELRYLRDKQKRELDFLAVRDRKPWFLAEVKLSDKTIAPSLGYFQGQIKAPHAFQPVMNLPYEAADCFSAHRPTVVPARTLLSQLP